MRIRDRIQNWWRIDPESADATSRFFWRVFQIVWFFGWLALQMPPQPKAKPELAADSTFVTDSAFSANYSHCATWTYSGVWANGKRITPRVEGIACGFNTVPPPESECKKVQTSHGPIMLCIKEGEAHVGPAK